MADAEAFPDLAGQAFERGVGFGSVASQMDGQGGFGRAQSPDVQIVDIRHTWQGAQIRLDRALVDTAGHAVEREGDGIAQQ